MTATEIMARFQSLMPEGIRFAAAFPMPYKDEEGEWHVPADDALVVRVSTRTHFVDAMCREEDLTLTDEMFSERILTPMLTMLGNSLRNNDESGVA